MYAKEVRQRFMAITEEFFRDNGYRITKTKFYKKFEEFTIKVVINSYEPRQISSETGPRVVADPTMTFELMFDGDFCEKLGIPAWGNFERGAVPPIEIVNFCINSCPIRKEKWQIASIEDFDRYRVGIRLRCLEFMEKAETLRDPRVHFRYRFGSKDSNPQNLGSYDERKAALYRIAQEFGTDDDEFIWGIERWVGQAREEYRELLYNVNAREKPLPPNVIVTYANPNDLFKVRATQFANGNKNLRDLAKALGLDPETWTIRNPVTGEID
jgi:hypothetical protein